MSAVLRVQGLSKTFSSKAGDVHALKDANLHVSPGELVIISGPSGSGKTTLLQLLGLLILPTTGTVSIDENPVSLESEAARSRVRLTSIGFIFQDFKLISSLTAAENISLPLLMSGSKENAIEKSYKLLEQVGLGSKASSNIEFLSGGEKQRIAIARALVNDPRLILADEPTANLDTSAANGVLELIKQLLSKQSGCVVVTHDERLYGYADRVLQLVDGKLVT